MSVHSIGEVAAAAGVNVQTVRYYERRGILTPVRRTPAGYRQYDDNAVARLRFIRHAQSLGFSLNEIDELLALRIRNADACRGVEQKTREKIADVDRRIRDLQRIRRTLNLLVAACKARRTTEDCPVLEALSHDFDTNR